MPLWYADCPDGRGSTFTHHDGCLLEGHDTAVLPGFTFEEDCREYCLQVTSFVCLSYEMAVGRCSLSKSSFATLPDRRKCFAWHDLRIHVWDYYQRTCDEDGTVKSFFLLHIHYEEASFHDRWRRRAPYVMVHVWCKPQLVMIVW